LKTPKHRGPRPIGDAIHAFLRESGLGLSAREARVFRAWHDAVDPVTRSRTTPVRFTHGTLTVEVGSAPLLQELRSFTGEAARVRANAAFSEPPIRRVVFKSKGT